MVVTQKVKIHSDKNNKALNFTEFNLFTQMEKKNARKDNSWENCNSTKMTILFFCNEIGLALIEINWWTIQRIYKTKGVQK